MVIQTAKRSGAGRVTSIPVERLVFDREFYVRLGGTNWQTVAKYADAMRMDREFPPIYVVPTVDADDMALRRHPDGYFVLDGWHRAEAASKIGHKTIKAIVDGALSKKRREREWLAKAARLNSEHGRALSPQDRTALALRLQKAGLGKRAIAETLATPQKTLERWLLGRVTGGNGKVVKAAMSPLIGTRDEALAVAHGGAIANANANRTLDEMLAILRAKLVDVADPMVAKKATEIHERLGKLLEG